MTTSNNGSALARALSILGFSSGDAKVASDILLDTTIEKASTAQDLSPSEHVSDRWESGKMHAVPTKDEIKVGPTEHASGGGAEKMVKDYSNPAPQHGIQLEAERLANELGQMRGYMRSNAETMDRISKHNTTLTGIVTALLMKSAEDNDGGDGTEAAAFAEKSARVSRDTFTSAKRLLGKAEKLETNMGDVKKAERQVIKAQIRALRKRAARLMLNAVNTSFAAKSGDADPAADVRKSVRELVDEDRILKADINALHEKDEKKDEEKKMAKALRKLAKRAAKKAAAKAAKKAAAQAAAAGEAGKSEGTGGASEAAKTQMQADKQDPETKNQDDSSKTEKAAAEQAEQVKKALEGIGLMQGTMQQVLEIVAGRPLTSGATEPLTLMKGDPGTTFLTIDGRIEDAMADNKLDNGGAMKARDLLQKVSAVRSGAMSEDMWRSMLRQSPPAVQEIFREAA